VRGPRAVVDYLRGRWTGTGHTPLGALSVLALLLAISVQVGLGLFSEDEDGIFMGPLAKLVSSDTSDKLRDIHALWFYLVVSLVELAVEANSHEPTALPSDDRSTGERTAVQYHCRSNGQARRAIQLRTGGRQVEELNGMTLSVGLKKGRHRHRHTRIGAAVFVRRTVFRG